MISSEAKAVTRRMVLAGFEGERPDAAACRVLESGVFGMILFGASCQDAAVAKAILKERKAAAPAGLPLICSVDQEGGRVRRFGEADIIALPAARMLGAVDDLVLTEHLAAAMGRQLRAMGFDLDFAPSVDVDTNPANPVIGTRSFGRTPEIVGRHASAYIRGLQGAGVAGCAKHFPGHGDTVVDSHLDLPQLKHDLQRLGQTEFPPFKAAMDAGVASIMTAHVVMEAVDASRPATMSAKVLGLLRGQVGWGGLVFSDDLEMKAVAGRWDLGEAAVEAVVAGVDVVLVCHQTEEQEKVIERLAKAIDAGVISKGEVARKLERIEGFVKRWARQIS